MNLKKYYLYILLGLILSIVYRAWIFNEYIIGGDWPFMFNEAIRNFPLFVPSWVSWQGNGLGGTNPAYFIQTYQFLTIYIANNLLLSWEITARIFWFGLFLVLAPFSLISLMKTVQKDMPLWTYMLGAVIYTTNSYILMITSGGQMGVALAYAFAPLVIAQFIKLIISNNNKIMLFAGLYLGIQTTLDPRIAYTTLFVVGLIFFFYITQHFISIDIHKQSMIKVATLTLRIAIVGVITLAFNLFWLLPLFIYRQNPIEDLGSAYSSIASLKFFSFAQFSQSFSLLHPNWPDNIFGKISFMKPEFILLPIIAYSNLLFLSNKPHDKKERKIIIFFIFLGLVGAFLAKGANLPFGELYIWMFENIPGFVMFRDPTKWYILVAISFSILIPLSLVSYSTFFSKYIDTYKVTRGIIFLFISLWILLIKNVFYPGLQGTFSTQSVPSEYIELKNMLVNEKQFFRVLWIPRLSRFGYTSFNHPSIEGQFLMNATNSAEFAKVFADTSVQAKLTNMSIKYVVIPYDSQNEIFLEDRKYNHKDRESLENVLDNVSWLKKIRNDNIAVYETKSYNEHFWLESGDKIKYKMHSSDNYTLDTTITRPTKLIFSEKYSYQWVANVNGKIVKAVKYKNEFNSFQLDSTGEYTINIYYLQDIYYTYGRYLSISTFLFICVSIIILHNKKNSN